MNTAFARNPACGVTKIKYLTYSDRVESKFPEFWAPGTKLFLHRRRKHFFSLSSQPSNHAPSFHPTMYNSTPDAAAPKAAAPSRTTVGILLGATVGWVT